MKMHRICFRGTHLNILTYCYIICKTKRLQRTLCFSLLWGSVWVKCYRSSEGQHVWSGSYIILFIYFWHLCMCCTEVPCEQRPHWVHSTEHDEVFIFSTNFNFVFFCLNERIGTIRCTLTLPTSPSVSRTLCWCGCHASTSGFVPPSTSSTSVATTVVTYVWVSSTRPKLWVSTPLSLHNRFYHKYGPH